jgi:hypothetical protein
MPKLSLAKLKRHIGSLEDESGGSLPVPFRDEGVTDEPQCRPRPAARQAVRKKTGRLTREDHGRGFGFKTGRFVDSAPPEAQHHPRGTGAPRPR